MEAISRKQWLTSNWRAPTTDVHYWLDKVRLVEWPSQCINSVYFVDSIQGFSLAETQLINFCYYCFSNCTSRCPGMPVDSWVCCCWDSLNIWGNGDTCHLSDPMKYHLKVDCIFSISCTTFISMASFLWEIKSLVDAMIKKQVPYENSYVTRN